MDTDKQYLGDGVYIERSEDPYVIRLSAPEGSDLHGLAKQIFLEADMIWGLINYATKHGIIKEPPNA